MPSDAPILVIGGRGFVGAAAVTRLLADRRRVLCFGPAGPVTLPAGAIEIPGTIEDGDALRRLLAEAAPAAVISFAAYAQGPVGLARSAEADPEAALAVNVLGFRRLLEACAAAAVARVVWMSSTVVLGPAASLDLRLDETAPRRPANLYALTKTLAEDIADYARRRHGLAVTGLRIPLMLGRQLWYDGAAAPLKRLVAAAHLGTVAEVAVPAIPFDVLHVADLADLVASMIVHPAPGALYNIAGLTIGYREVAACLGDLCPGFRATLIEETPPIVYPLVSQARLEADLPWRPRRDLRAILQDMLAEQRGTA